MKAILLYEAGGVDKLIYQDIDMPVLENGQVLVKVKAIGINPMDTGIRSDNDFLTRFLGEKRPVILGWDISGDVVGKAGDVDEFTVGDRVIGLMDRGGGYAEYVAINKDNLVQMPENISYEEAAAVPVAAITAWQALKRGNIQKGDRVLIHAGSGGVGHYAIQIAKYLGATVITTTSGKNKEFVLSLGADQHIDYTKQNFYDVLKDVGFVLDSIRGDNLTHSIDVTKNGGTVVSIIPPLKEELVKKAEKRGVNLSLLIGYSDKDDARFLTDLLQRGILKSHVTAVYPFSQMAAAHLQMETGRIVGKIVVKL